MEEAPEPRSKAKTAIVFAMLFAVLGAVVVFAYLATFSRPVTTVILVRHAEKNIEPGNRDPNLSPAGQARARELARMLEGAGVTAIYVTQYVRTQQTVQPLASKIGVPVTQIDAGNTAELVRRISSNRGGVILMAGHNNTVPATVKALGGSGDYPVIPEDEYDNMFIVTIYRTGQAKVVKLKYGAPSPTGGGSGTMVP